MRLGLWLITVQSTLNIICSGEIVELHKNKNITIVSATEKLVTKDFDDKFQNTIRSFIEQNNVKVDNDIYNKNNNNKK